MAEAAARAPGSPAAPAPGGGMNQAQEPALGALPVTDNKNTAPVPIFRSRQRELRTPGKIHVFTVCDITELFWCQF